MTAAILLSTMGCANSVRALKPNEGKVIPHAIFVHPSGDGLRTEVGKKSTRLTPSEFEKNLQKMFDTMRADTRSITRDSAGNETRHVLIRVHGGLNQLESSLIKSVNLLEAIEKDTDPSARTYPIFINWESGLWSTLQERYGLDGTFGRRRRLLRVPLDLGVGVVRFLPSLTHQTFGLDRDFSRDHLEEVVPSATPQVAGKATQGPADVKAAESAVIAEADAGVRQAAQRKLIDPATKENPTARIVAHGDALAFSRFSYRRTRKEKIWHLGSSFVLNVAPALAYAPGTSYMRHHVIAWIPPKFYSLFFVEALGRPAWETMHGRTTRMFRPDRDIKTEKVQRVATNVSGYRPPSGATALFAAGLAKTIAEDSTRKYEITIIGHSMGAIVANQIVREYPNLPWKNVVLMASAASTNEVRTGILPVLVQANRAGREMELFNLALHPWAERRESQSVFHIPLVPYGSLLEWIDAFYGYQETPLDRMFGKNDNLIGASALFPPDIRGHVHFKVFGYRSGKECQATHKGHKIDAPYTHGSFNANELPFWHLQFWHPGTAGCVEVQQRAKIAMSLRLVPFPQHLIQ